MTHQRHQSPLRRKISTKNQVALPVILLKKFRILPGGEVIIEEGKDGIMIKAAIDPIKALRGCLSDLSMTSQQIKDELRREEREYERRKFGI